MFAAGRTGQGKVTDADIQVRKEGFGSTRLCAVLVLYGPSFREAACWPALEAYFGRPPRAGGAVLERVLVYDNSPSNNASRDHDPPWVNCIHDPANGGTGAAYGHAVEWAAAQQADWLLLLDHDTALPTDFIGLCLETIYSLERTARVAGPTIALVPLVVHGRQVVSPSRIGRLGRVIPLPPSAAGTDLPPGSTAIASGAVLRVDALQQVMPLPQGLWLDYVDHWLFRELRRHGTVMGIGATLSHDLSVATPRRTSDARLRSVVGGEAIFLRKESLLARIAFRLRLLKRALLRSALSPRQRWFLVGFAFGLQSDDPECSATTGRTPPP